MTNKPTKLNAPFGSEETANQILLWFGFTTTKPNHAYKGSTKEPYG